MSQLTEILNREIGLWTAGDLLLALGFVLVGFVLRAILDSLVKHRLMALAEDHAEEMSGESLTLEVRVSNVEALALYEALEYECVETRHAYYQDGEDAVVMTKRMRS